MKGIGGLTITYLRLNIKVANSEASGKITITYTRFYIGVAKSKASGKITITRLNIGVDNK